MKKSIFTILAITLVTIPVFAQMKAEWSSIDRITCSYSHYEGGKVIFADYTGDHVTLVCENTWYEQKDTCQLSEEDVSQFLQTFKSAFFDSNPILGKNDEEAYSDQPFVTITCYSKKKIVYNRTIYYEIGYTFSSAYKQWEDELLMLYKKCSKSEEQR